MFLWASRMVQSHLFFTRIRVIFSEYCVWEYNSYYTEFSVKSSPWFKGNLFFYKSASTDYNYFSWIVCIPLYMFCSFHFPIVPIYFSISKIQNIIHYKKPLLKTKWTSVYLCHNLRWQVLNNSQLKEKRTRYLIFGFPSPLWLSLIFTLFQNGWLLSNLENMDLSQMASFPKPLEEFLEEKRTPYTL